MPRHHTTDLSLRAWHIAKREADKAWQNAPVNEVPDYYGIMVTIHDAAASEFGAFPALRLSQRDNVKDMVKRGRAR